MDVMTAALIISNVGTVGALAHLYRAHAEVKRDMASLPESFAAICRLVASSTKQNADSLDLNVLAITAIAEATKTLADALAKTDVAAKAGADLLDQVIKESSQLLNGHNGALLQLQKFSAIQTQAIGQMQRAMIPNSDLN